MAGLLEAITAGAVGGAGKGLSENAKTEIDFNYDQMQAEIKAAMDERIYERGRKDKATDEASAYEREKGLINLRAEKERDPLAQKIKQEQLNALLEEKKIPAAVKTEYSSLQKQSEQIGSAIYKAQAEGTFDTNSESAKSMMSQLDAIRKRQGELLKPYLGEAAPKEPSGIDLSAFDKGAKAAGQAQPEQAKAQPGKPSMSAQEKNDLLQQARDIKAKYGNKIPSKYFSGGLSEKEQAVIDAADKASPGWRNF